MKKLFAQLSLLLLPAAAAFMPSPCAAQIDTAVFSLLSLDRPGMERVAALHDAGDDEAAAAELLHYFRRRSGVTTPFVDTVNIAITDEERRWADEGMEHRFFVHTGYQPSFHYGDDIDWQYWPVHDNELRWQLHRMKWWAPMGKRFRETGDERYAREWMAQYLDWMRKNPLTAYHRSENIELETADNVYFAWRPLEVSDRLEFQIHQFLYFLPALDAGFLTHFLVNYHRHAEHITGHFSKQGNHLLFEAQRLVFAGVFFPEFRDAAQWRARGAGILGREIGVQVYDDGMQYELDPHYHLESINIFYNALRMMTANGYRDELPDGYLDKVRSMVEILYNISFPDYTNPMFGDAKQHGRDFLLPSYRAWAEVFGDDAMVLRMATEGREGSVPDYLSRAFRTSGFYVLRSGWDAGATQMTLKAGPPAFWHNQPDNGTFELWRRGRNFFPDSGSYVYAGSREINELRQWFRRTRVHNTLTLDGRDLERTDSHCLAWSTGGKSDVAAVENPSYDSLSHRRWVFFVERRFFVIVDEAYGPAEGSVELNYNFIEGAELAADGSAATSFPDGNNILVRVFSDSPLAVQEREGWVSRSYRSRSERLSAAWKVAKGGAPVRFITVILPVDDASAHSVEARLRGEFDPHGVAADVKVDGRRYKLRYNL
ncbi:MAG: heparinase II/III family protein [Alistipes sp.]|nr:heparinase II/III family protein [Alistipes sp.]